MANAECVPQARKETKAMTILHTLDARLLDASLTPGGISFGRAIRK